MAKQANKPISTARLAQQIDDSQIFGTISEVHSCASFARAGAGDLTFIRDAKQLRQVDRAAFVMIPSQLDVDLDGRSGLIVDDVEWALSSLMELWDPWMPSLQTQIDPTAQIHPTAWVQGTVGADAVIGPFCSVPAGAIVGSASVLESHVSLATRVVIGDHCLLQAGVSVGSAGFGFGAQIDQPGQRLPHFGGVSLGDFVHIGSNSQIASGRFFPTQIGNRTKIDALVQIGHNCILGSDCYMAGQSGLAGSVELGDGVLVGGGASISGHLQIGAGAVITGRAVVLKDVPAGAKFSGFPAREHYRWLRGLAR